jgi:signal transduction histidine kinase/ligand-binding sensor domain-containing protein
MAMGIRASVVAMLFVAHAAWAVDPAVHLTQYAHTAWRTQDGFFSGAPTAIAQTTDGYLWIGTANGLFRFDGVRFISFAYLAQQKQLESGEVSALLGSQDGGLWIGSSYRLFRWKDNTLASYSNRDEFVSSIIETRQGGIWLTRQRYTDHDGPLCQVQDRALHCYGEGDGVSLPPYATPLLEDADKNLWVGGGTKLLRWQLASSSVWSLKGLRQSDGLENLKALAIDRNNSLWVGINSGGAEPGLQQFHNGVWKTFSSSQLNGSGLAVSRLFLDRAGALWVGTEDQGIYRIIQGKVDHFDSTDGLSGNTIKDLFEDHEGTVWIATSKGIDSFRDLPVVTLSRREGLHSDTAQSVLSAADGTIWIGSEGALDAWRNGNITSILPKDGLPGQAVTSLLEDAARTLWVGVDNSLFRFARGKFVPIMQLSGGPHLLTDMTRGAGESVWALVGTATTGMLYQIHKGHVFERKNIPPQESELALAADARGAIWIAGDKLQYLDDSGGKTLSEFGPRYGYIRNIAIDHDGFVWFGATKGLLGFKDGRLQAMTTSNGLPCERINTLIVDKQRSLWLYAQCGLIKIERSELEKWWRHPDVRVKSTMLDALDGFQGGPSSFRPAATRSADGRLWFVNGSLVQTINPDQLYVNRVPPPVHIEQVTADARNYPPENVIQFPKLSRNIEIKYTALSLVVPLRVRFRYKLDGYETVWQEAGTRRSAFYSNLRPGTYKFLVIACNNDGVWNQTGAALNFVIAPAFYQTVWFQVLLGLMGVGLIGIIHSFRLRQATAQVQARVEERLEERGRIARELHDTLIQSVDALMLYLQAAIDQPDRERSRQMLEKALDRADEALSEGRERVHTLRIEATSVQDLAQALTDYGEGRAQDHAMEFSVTLVGNPRPLDPIVRDETFRIGREALANAFQHSNASRIEVELTYDRKGIRLRIRDDGRGIDPQIIGTGRPGHWGLSGMRERANQVGELNIWSRLHIGTEIDLTIPARVAYQRRFRVFPLSWITSKANNDGAKL